MKSTGRVVVASISAAAWLLGAGSAFATLAIQKKAKDTGLPAASCLYCHNEKLPKKGAMTHNERGKWLLGQKEAKKAKEVDPSWLKDYPGK